MLRAYIPGIFLFLLSFSVGAQTCCSGGVPISSNLGLPPSEKQTFQVSLTYDLNVLRTLQSGWQVLEQVTQSSERVTHSAMLQLGYNFTERLSADAFFSYVYQERITTRPPE